MGIRQDLDLQVAGAADEALQVDVVLAEGGVCLAPGREKRGLELVLGLDPAHAAPAAAPARLEHAGEAHVADKVERLRGVRGQGASVAGTVGTPARAAMARADTLSPSRRRVSGRGPMKAIPASAQASANSGDSERKP